MGLIFLSWPAQQAVFPWQCCPVPPLEQLCACGSPSRVSLAAAAAVTLALPALHCCWDSFKSLLLSPVRCCCCCWGLCHCCVSISEVSMGQLQLKPISLANVFSHLFCLGSPCRHFPGDERLGLCSDLCCGFCFCCFGAEHRALLCTCPGLCVCSVLSILAGRALERGQQGWDQPCPGEQPMEPGLLPWALEEFSLCTGHWGGMLGSVAFLGCCELCAQCTVHCAVFPGSGRAVGSLSAGARNCP